MTVCVDWMEYLNSGMLDDSKQYASPLIHQMTKVELAKLLPHFVLDIRNKNGDPYPPSTLYQLYCDLLRQICITNPSWNIFDDPDFTDYQKCLDRIMKKLKADRLMNERTWILFAVIQYPTITIFHPVHPNSHSPSSILLSDQRNRG